MAIQMARYFGIKAHVTAGSDKKCKDCLALGANSAINYREKDFAAEIAKITENNGVNLVLDMAGAITLAKTSNALVRMERI